MLGSIDLLPPEPRQRGVCAWCGDEIYEGESIFVGDEGRIHSECILPLILHRLGDAHIALLCGYEEAIA